MPNNSPKKQFQETVQHFTQKRPYSLHYTNVPEGCSQALYLHWHSEAEFFYLESGEAHVYVGSKSYQLLAGDAILIPPFLLHHAVCNLEFPCSHYAFVFSPSLLTDSTADCSYHEYIGLLSGKSDIDCIYLHPDELWKEQALSILSNIFCYKEQAPHSCQLAIHGEFLLLWQLIINHTQACSLSNFPSTLSIQLEPALTYINENYAADLSLVQLSSLVYLSREQFCRSFKRLTGVTPFTYLNRLRIQKCCELLSHSDKKIADIACLCGFNNISYFNREFKKFMNMTPLEYQSL